MALTSYLKAIADAIRFAEDSNEPINAKDFEARIRALKGRKPSTDGVWQLDSTPNKKFIILSTDDDNESNTAYFRMLRSYGFPYTMNVEAENVNKMLESDADSKYSSFSGDTSLFPSGVTVDTLAKYIHDNNLGEVTQHGYSDDTLWDSSKLIDSALDTIYADYVSKGGTKSKEDFKDAVIEAGKNTDVQNDAPYVTTSKATIESAIGFPINAIAIWGGTPHTEIDGITVSLNSIKDISSFTFLKDKGYTYGGTRLEAYRNGTDIFGKHRDSNFTLVQDAIDKLVMGDIIDCYVHAPFTDYGEDAIITTLNTVKANVDNGTLEVITPSQYVSMGSYTTNPITSISVSRTAIDMGNDDSDADYNILVTFADGTSKAPESDVIIDRSSVNTSQAGTYQVTVYYRGFNATCNVVVNNASMTLPDALKTTDYWFVYRNENTGNMYCGNNSNQIQKASLVAGNVVFGCVTGGKINGWKSIDDGASWTQVTTNEPAYTNVKTNGTANAFAFDADGTNASPDTISWIDTSSNFVLENW